MMWLQSIYCQDSIVWDDVYEFSGPVGFGVIYSSVNLLVYIFAL